MSGIVSTVKVFIHPRYGADSPVFGAGWYGLFIGGADYVIPESKNRNVHLTPARLEGQRGGEAKQQRRTE